MARTSPPQSTARSWAILPPWFNSFTECYADTKTLRIALAGTARTTVVKTSAMSAAELTCPGPSGSIAAAVAPNGRLDAVARTPRTDPGSPAGNGVVDLFQFSDDARLASINVTFPPHFSGVRCSASSNYVVLDDSPEAGAPKGTQWLRIAAAAR